MNQDFVTTLRLQLREAAEREARRGPLRRALPQARPLALAGALAALVLALVVAAGLLRGHEDVATTEHAPHVVARIAVADQGGGIAPGFGSIWATDSAGSRVVRVALSGGVSASIPFRAPRLLSINTGAGAVWVLTDDELVRIDPATNRIVAHIPLPPPSGNAFDVIAGRGVMWVLTGSQMLRVDPARNAIDRRIGTDHGGLAALSYSSDGQTMYLLRGDRRLVGLDAGTGERLSISRPAVEGNAINSVGHTVVFATPTALTAVDGPSGRPSWRRNLGVRKLNAGVLDNGGLWVQGTPVNGSADQLWRLDRKGRVTASLPAPDFGAAGMASTSRALWIMSPAGVLTEIR
jgi:hypothetical protein